MIHKEDLSREQGRAQYKIEIRGFHREAFLDAKEVHADDGNEHRNPGLKGALPEQDHLHQGHQYDIEGCHKPRLAGGGSRVQGILLGVGREKQRRPAEETPQNNLPQAAHALSHPPKDDAEGKKNHKGDKKPDCADAEGSQVLCAERLGRKCCPPDHRRDKGQKCLFPFHKAKSTMSLYFEVTSKSAVNYFFRPLPLICSILRRRI